MAFTLFPAPATAQEANAPAIMHSEAHQAATADLARLLLPAEEAGRVLTHRVSTHYFQRDYAEGVSFYFAPTPLGDDLCRREGRYVGVDPTPLGAFPGSRPPTPPDQTPLVVEGGPYPIVGLALSPACAIGPAGSFAHVQPSTDVDRAAQALRALAALQLSARQGALQDSQFDCLDEVGEGQCDAGGVNALAGMDLNGLASIGYVRSLGMRHWQFHVVPTPGGGRFWQIQVHDDATRPTRLRWMIPPPF